MCDPTTGVTRRRRSHAFLSTPCFPSRRQARFAPPANHIVDRLVCPGQNGRPFGVETTQRLANLSVYFREPEFDAGSPEGVEQLHEELRAREVDVWDALHD